MTLLREKAKKVSFESLCLLNEFTITRELRKKAKLNDFIGDFEITNNKYFEDEKELKEICKISQNKKKEIIQLI